uniref:F-box domain-containing protein n=1 Tax=Hyaloperonospora arabidopsidis (strain Emoy2) TaxID=559515 RepID=M4B1P0_HYAAE
MQGALAAIAWSILTYYDLPQRVHDLVGSLFLVLMLMDRWNLRSWPSEKSRRFFDLCTWIASVLSLYMMCHSVWITIGGGAAAALVVACASELAASVPLPEKQRLNFYLTSSTRSMMWLKYLLLYGCLGCVIVGTGTTLRDYVMDDMNSDREHETPRRSIDRVVDNYWISVLVGASLILANELLLLCPFPRRVSPPNLQAEEVEIPTGYWVKLIPLVWMLVYVFFQVHAAIRCATNVPPTLLALMLALVIVGTITLTFLTPSSQKPPWTELLRCGRQSAAKMCVGGVTLIAPMVSHGPPGVIFSCGLSAFCIAFSRECWDDIESNGGGQARETRLTVLDLPLAAGTCDSPLTNDVGCSSGVPQSWSARALGAVKERYPRFYERVKWTFAGITVVSTFDLCSTFLAVTNNNETLLSLSQYSAINVVVSASVGYLTSPAPYKLHPAVLIHTGVKQFKNKWAVFPLHMFVETLISAGVFVGTFTASSTAFSSLTLAALSGIVVSVGGHSVCSRLHLTIGTHVRMQLTATCALLFCSFLITYASMVSLLSIYHYFDSIEAAFCLASFAGIFFLAASELFLMWGPTRDVGLLLQGRVTNAKENWQQEPLRSFLELFTWFAVIWGSFAMYNDLLLALQLGTFSGIAVTLSGEFFRKTRLKLIPWDYDLLTESETITSPMSPPAIVRSSITGPGEALPLPVMLLFTYVGSGTFQWIFENMRSLEVTVLLATIAGIFFLCCADMLVLFEPTRWAGVILQDRFINVKHNWREYPVRSFVELGCFVGVIYGSYAIYHDLIVAVQVGTLSGIVVTLGGEQVRSCARALPMSEAGKSEVEKVQILPLPVMGLLGLIGAVAFNIIYTHLRSIEVAFVLATTSGIIFALVGDMFVIWKPTRKVGMVIQERILYVRQNFATHTCRSWMEVVSLCGGWYISYDFLWPRDILVAIQFGTTLGIVTCVCGELTMEFVAETERRLMADISARLANDSQRNSVFFNLPYEIQFKVAYFLAAEDLLVARATCHKVNNMLKAESARFWLHASLRRTVRDHSDPRGCSRSHGICHRMENRARSLVCEAITLLVPKIMGARDPAQVLTSGNEVNRALKWVYLNADWIRRQNLPPLVREGGTDNALVTLSAGDVAFDVFRHMPDKSSLGVIVTRDDNFAIECIEVPRGVYYTIQRDPFSFVAAETLSGLNVFSNWHLTIVAFATMTLIFIGQFLSDLFRAFILPNSPT